MDLSSKNFGFVDLPNLVFPAVMRVDYVRVSPIYHARRAGTDDVPPRCINRPTPSMSAATLLATPRATTFARTSPSTRIPTSPS